MTKGISVTQLLTKKRKLMPFDGEFLASFGIPELIGCWLFWGVSGSGKTTFVLKLCKYLTRFGKVLYNSMEEGDSESMKLAVIRAGIEQVKRRIVFLDNESIDDLKLRLRRKKAPRIVIIDSVQYSGMSYNDYKSLRKEFKYTLFIMISHADGKEPRGKVAQQIRYDSFIKGRVEGYKAFITSRYGGGAPFIVWKEKADSYHGAETFS